MSKKKSYMNVKNILSEDIISSFLKGLLKGITGKKRKPKDVKKIKKELQKSVDRFNNGLELMQKASDEIRKADGKNPRKRIKKLTVKDVMDDYAKGKL
tara:strand:+ start:271 stop:564 length:294 start_codon:yes stop_codon:yes gene_type:complete